MQATLLVIDYCMSLTISYLLKNNLIDPSVFPHDLLSAFELIELLL